VIIFLNHTSSTQNAPKVKAARAFSILTFFLLLGTVIVHIFSAIKLHALLRTISSILYGVVALFGLIATATFADEEKVWINNIPKFYAFDAKLIWGYGFGLFATGWLLSLWIAVVYITLAFCFDNSDFSLYESKESKPSNQREFSSVPLTTSPSQSTLPTQSSSLNINTNMTTTTNDTTTTPQNDRPITPKNISRPNTPKNLNTSNNFDTKSNDEKSNETSPQETSTVTIDSA